MIATLLMATKRSIRRGQTTRRRGSVVALALLILVSSVGNSSTSAEEVRVMSFNIRYGKARDGENHWDRRREFVAETIRKADPDLIGTQETLEFQKAFLDERLSGYVSFGVGRDDGSERGEMTALFVKKDRFKVLSNGHFWLSETPDVPGSKSWDTSLTRMASWVRLEDRLDPRGKPILFLNTHFDHRGSEARKRSAELIAAESDRLAEGASIVITGDFNAAVDSEPYKALFQPSISDASDDRRNIRLRDTYRVAAMEGTWKDPKGEATFSGFKAGVTEGARIDWIAVSDDWNVLSAAIDRTARDGRTPSDHHPVIAIVKRR